jgi:hypothetical protein
VIWVALALVVAPAARAGGDFVDLAVGAGRVWFVGPPGVFELDAATGRTRATPQLQGAAYPLSVTLAGGAAWVASVENGFVAGKLSRIDLQTRRPRVVFRIADGSVQYVAAGANSVWALLGGSSGSEIARFSLDGRLLRTWRIAAAGRMAADGEGCWVSTGRQLLHIALDGRVRSVLRAPLGDVATGDGAVWLPRATSVLMLDERTGRVRTIATGPLSLGGFQHDVGAVDGSLWVLEHSESPRGSALVRFDLRSGRSTARVGIAGIADALAVTPSAVWVATVLAPVGRPATGYEVRRIDPRTLRSTVVAHIP